MKLFRVWVKKKKTDKLAYGYFNVVALNKAKAKEKVEDFSQNDIVDTVMPNLFVGTNRFKKERVISKVEY